MSNYKQGKRNPVWGLIAMITVVAWIAVCYNAIKDISVGDVIDEMSISDPPVPDEQSESGRLVVLRVEPEGYDSSITGFEDVPWSVSEERVARNEKSRLEDLLGVDVTVRVLKEGEYEVPDFGDDPVIPESPLPTCSDLAAQFYPGTCGLVDSINEGEPLNDWDIIITGLEQYQPYQSCGGPAEACLPPN